MRGVNNTKAYVSALNTCIRTVDWAEAKRLLREFALAPDVSAYQSMEFLSITGKGRKFHAKNLRNLRGIKEHNLVQFRNGSVCAFAPLLINAYQKKIVLRGHYTSCGQLGFLYASNWGYDDFSILLNTIKERFAGYNIEFKRINEKTLLCYYLTQYCGSDYTVKTSPCVSICISEGYEKWYEGLSKSTRQNIRTSYNRLEKSELNMRMEFKLGGHEKQKELWKKLIVYSRRTLTRNCMPVIFPKKLLHIAGAFNKYLDPMTKALNRMDKSFSAVLYFDDNIAAFLNGFVSEEHRLIIPRLAINEAYKFYSAGGILINETIKYLRTNFANGVIDQFDLSIGDEPYKFAYGGTLYNNYNFTIN